MKLFLLIFLVSLAFTSCGMFEKEDDDVEVIYKDPVEKEKEKPKEESVSWDALASVIKAKCASCHATQAPKLLPKAQYDKVQGKAKAAVLSGSMPPSGPLSDAEKALFEGYKG